MNQIKQNSKFSWYIRALFPLATAIIHIILVLTSEGEPLITIDNLDPLIVLIVFLIIYLWIFLISYFILFPKMNIKDPLNEDYEKTKITLFIVTMVPSFVIFTYTLFFVANLGLVDVLIGAPSVIGFYLINKWTSMDLRKKI